MQEIDKTKLRFTLTFNQLNKIPCRMMIGELFFTKGQYSENERENIVFGVFMWELNG